MFIGIEIGGTKLQIGFGAADGSLIGDIAKLTVDSEKGAQGIRDQITSNVVLSHVIRSPIRAIGVGFGGPVDSKSGRIIKSHQIVGWDDFPIGDWLQSAFGVPVALGNDSDLAGWAEAKLGAGLGAETVVYSNIGSGIGGAFIRRGEFYSGQGISAAEIGHLRVTPTAPGAPWRTLEEVASGWALDRIACNVLGDERANAADLAAAASTGNMAAATAWNQAVEYWGVAFANVATLLCPDCFIVGGGVALQGDFLLEGLREVFARNVFPPFRGRCNVVLAELGENMVVQGAILLAAKASGAA